MASLRNGTQSQEAAEEDPGAETKEKGDDATYRLILVGKSGGGKSATGNTILGRKAFESLLAAKTTTLKCQKEHVTWNGRTISVLDTPALFDSDKVDPSLEPQLESCRRLCQYGLHAFLLVTQVGRFTAEDAAAAQQVWATFGPKAANHTIVLFTCKEDLGTETLETYVQKSQNKKLHQLMEKCGNRLCGFNNKAEGGDRETQMASMMVVLEEMVEKNQGKPYVIPQRSEKPKLSSLLGWVKKKKSKH